MKNLGIIKSRIEAGETQNAIRSWLISEAGFDMSASQFSRHIKSFGFAADPGTPIDAPRSSHRTAEVLPEKKSEPLIESKRKPLTPADFKAIRNEPIDTRRLSQPVKRTK